MTARRHPTSLEAAIARAAKPLGGVSNASLALGKSRYLVPHAANPNKPDMLRLDDAIMLDQLCMDAGGGTPILAYFRAALAPEDGPRASFHAHLAALVRESSEVAAALAEGLEDNELNRIERRSLLSDAERLRVELGALISDLKTESKS